jgi:hypothetical protein
MAEYVQQSVEEMLPELVQMERVGLFTAVETRWNIKHTIIYSIQIHKYKKFIF